MSTELPDATAAEPRMGMVEAAGPRSRPAVVARALRSPGTCELLLLAGLYVSYSLSRTFADKALLPAEARAKSIAALEHGLHVGWEAGFNAFYSQHATLSLVSDYWYCTAHYLLTPAVLIWLYRQGTATYRPMRRALVLATVIALAFYIILPTAPPRLLPGYVDVLAQHAHQGWWGQDASAPKGMGGLTNQLAAFPSMHAGYALWVAIAIHRHSHTRWIKVIGWATAAMTATTVLGTANHWVLDVVAGWAIVVLAVALTDADILQKLGLLQPLDGTGSSLERHPHPPMRAVRSSESRSSRRW